MTPEALLFGWSINYLVVSSSARNEHVAEPPGHSISSFMKGAGPSDAVRRLSRLVLLSILFQENTNPKDKQRPLFVVENSKLHVIWSAEILEKQEHWLAISCCKVTPETHTDTSSPQGHDAEANSSNRTGTRSLIAAKFMSSVTWDLANLLFSILLNYRRSRKGYLVSKIRCRHNGFASTFPSHASTTGLEPLALLES